MPDIFAEFESYRKRPKPGAGLAGGVPIRRATPEEIEANKPGFLDSFLNDAANAFQKGVVEPAIDFYNDPGGTLDRFTQYTGGAGTPGSPALPPRIVQNAQAEAARTKERAIAARPESIRRTGAYLEAEANRPRTRAGRVGGIAGSLVGGAVAPFEPESAAANALLGVVGGGALKGAGLAGRAGLRRLKLLRDIPSASAGEAGAAIEGAGRVASTLPETGAAEAAVAPKITRTEAMRKLRNEGFTRAEAEAEIEKLGIPRRSAAETLGINEPTQLRTSTDPFEIAPETDPLEISVGGTPGPRAPSRAENAYVMEAATSGGAGGSATRVSAPSTGADLALQNLGQANNLRQYGSAFRQVAKQSPKEAAKVVGKEVLSAPRALLSSGDLSAPLRQGAILTLSPRNAPQAAKAVGNMLRSFSTSQFDQINADILNRAQATGALESGLYLAANKAKTGAEEAFSSRLLQTIPGLKQWLGASERTYTSYLDTLRQSVFEKYAKNIQKAGLAPEASAKAMQDAARFINYATGRGSFGKSIDKAIEPLGAVLFAPRYTASRFNILNPATYAKMSGPARKEAIKDLVGFVGVVTTTLGLAKAAGAEVALDPRDTDFGKIKIGRRRYDVAAGLIQPIRTLARIADDLYSGGGKTPQIAGRFARSKLSPVASLIYDAAAQKDYTGKPFQLDKALIDRMVPLFEKDIYDAIKEDGIEGGLMTLPGGLGVGVQNFEAPQTRPRKTLPRPRRRP
jgi:hypothetical protein